MLRKNKWYVIRNMHTYNSLKPLSWETVPLICLLRSSCLWSVGVKEDLGLSFCIKPLCHIYYMKWNEIERLTLLSLGRGATQGLRHSSENWRDTLSAGTGNTETGNSAKDFPLIRTVFILNLAWEEFWPWLDYKWINPSRQKKKYICVCVCI